MKKSKSVLTANQLNKSINRLGKITVLGALAKRASNWAKMESDVEAKKAIAKLADRAALVEQGRQSILAQVMELVEAGYMPPKKSNSGELKFETGRQVWFKAKYVETYKEGGFTDMQLQNLYVSKVVKGRVFLSLGKPDPESTEQVLLTTVPKVHVTATSPVFEVAVE